MMALVKHRLGLDVTLLSTPLIPSLPWSELGAMGLVLALDCELGAWHQGASSPTFFLYEVTLKTCVPANVNPQWRTETRSTLGSFYKPLTSSGLSSCHS